MREPFGKALRWLLLAIIVLSRQSAADEPPGAAAKTHGYRIYYGDLHGHTNVSDGTQNIETPKRETPEDYYRYGRDVVKLDFLALTDHAEQISEADWKHIQQVARQYDDPGRFVPMIGYEWSDEVKGHKVVLFPDLEGGPVYGAPSARNKPWLERPEEFLVPYERFFTLVRESGGIVHAAHPSLGDCRTDWDFHDAQLQLNVEMAGTTGNPGGLAEVWYEDPSTPRQHRAQQNITGCWVQDALARGYRLGFLGVNDTHSCEPGLKAKTAVLAKELSRHSIFDAVRQRRVYAVSCDRVAVWFEINGTEMGQELRTRDPLRIELAAACESPIARLEILKNNQVVWRREVDAAAGTLTAEDSPANGTTWYYGRVVLANGHQAWSSPIWVQKDNEDAHVTALQRKKYLLLDNRIIQSAVATKIAIGKVRKHPANPLFGEDKPWEVRFDNVYANVIYDDEEQLYKCWYSPFIVDMPRKEPGASYHVVPQREMGVCYATSHDGLYWEKPALGIVEYDGSTSNNILRRGTHGASVFKDTHESDSNRRYKMFFGLEVPGQKRRMQVAFSKDGLHFSDPIDIATGVEGDTHNVAFWAPTLNQYVGMTRLYAGTPPQRLVMRTQSQDFIKWSKAEEVFRGDLQRQTYAMPVFYSADLYLGLVMIYRADEDRVHCELAWSPDTMHWERIAPGEPLIATSDRPGDYDWGCVFAANSPIMRDDTIRLYYGASNHKHTSHRDGFLALATLRPDGFAGIRPTGDDQPGVVVTRPVVCTGKRLCVTADADGGSVQVEILDAEGSLLGRSEPITGDVTRETVVWKSMPDLADKVGKVVRLRFTLRQSTLYSFEFME